MPLNPDPVGWPWLRTNAATTLLDRLLQADREELAIKEQNDRILVQHVRESLDIDPIDPRRI